MSYAGTLKEDGSKFDSAKKFSFTIGAGEVIKGWDVGVKGMQVGGRRQLTVPPKLGYGKRGSPPEIPGDAALVFDIKLIAVK
jgi:FKBP-type peptidyl-prolyl cis-trans isomerase